MMLDDGPRRRLDIEEVRLRIVEGTYRPSSRDVADAILRVWSGEETADAWETQECPDESESA